MSIAGKLRVGIVGLGMGEDMLDALAKHPRVEVRALCDPLAARLHPLAAGYRVPGAYADFETMLAAEQLDGICIATPNYLHGPMARAALARGLHVMCEKPLALTAAEARALLDAARAAGVTHGVNFSNRTNPAVLFVQEEIARGVCGRIHEIHLSYLEDGLADPVAAYTWRNNRAASGSGALGDIGSHMLDLARLFVGEVASVSALLAIVTSERVRPDGTIGVVDADDLAYVHLRYASGAFGLLRASQTAQGNGNLRRVELFGDRAALVLEIDNALIRVLRADAHPGRAGDGFREVLALDPHLAAWSGNTLAWADAALDGRTMSPNFEDGLRVQEILDAAIRSHAERRWIDLATS